TRMPIAEVACEVPRRQLQVYRQRGKQSIRKAFALDVVVPDGRLEVRQVMRPLRLQQLAVRRPEVVNLFPVTRILGQLLVEVSPGIVGCTKNLPLLLDRLREKNAHRVRQVADYLRLDAVSCHLEKAPVPA